MNSVQDERSDVPRVTVLMPVLNAMPFLPEAVESVLSQTYQRILFYVLDDGSTDGSVDYVKSITDPRVRLIKGRGHCGLGAVLNRGLAMSRTEFVARMDGDDICTADRLQLQIDFLDQNPSVGAVGTQFAYLGSTGRVGFGRPLPLTHRDIMEALLRGRLSLIHASLMMRTDCMHAIGGYRFSGVGEDWDMFLRLGEVTSLANLPAKSYFYRVHENSATLRQRRLTQRRILYACECARARQQGLPEPTEEEFGQGLAHVPLFAKLREALNSASLSRYMAGRVQVLGGRPLLGYFNIILGAIVGPWRLLSRFNTPRLRRSGIRPRHSS